MIKLKNEELLIIRSALLKFKKAPFVSEGEQKVIKQIIDKIFKSLFEE